MHASFVFLILSYKLDGTLGKVLKKMAELSDTSKLAAELINDHKDGQEICVPNRLGTGNVDEVLKSKESRKRNRRQLKKNRKDVSSHQEMVSSKLNYFRFAEVDSKKDASRATTGCASNTNLISGIRVGQKEVLNIDGMELSYLLYMNNTSNKFAQRFTPYVQKFYAALVDGDIEGFKDKFTFIFQIVRRRSNRIHCSCLTQQEFAEHLMNSIVSNFFDKSESTSVLHHLAVTKNSNRPCDMSSHSCCRLIRTILSMLPWKDRRALLGICTKRTGKTALHLAAATGQSCQMQALMEFGAWPDCFDRSRRAPIHYAIMRNNLEMVKLLLWYGADISLKERSATPVQLASCSPETMPICEYLHTRVTALESIFGQWVRKYVRGVWSPVHAISNLHFLRLSKACDSRRDAIRNLITRSRNVYINMLETRTSNPQLKKYPLMLLFIVPTFYKEEDRIADPSNPQIFCVKLQNPGGSIVRLLPVRPLLSCSTWSVGISSALEKPHNGYFYVYKLPENMEVDLYTLHLTVELEELHVQAPQIALAIQAFACGPPDLTHYNELRGIGTNPSDKSKID